MNTLSQVKTHVVISYNAFIRAYAQSKHIDQAMETYRQVIDLQIQNAFTYHAIVAAFQHCDETEGIDQVAHDLVNDIRVWEHAKDFPKEKHALLSACYTLSQIGAPISASAIKERIRLWDL
jgi:pentatricopeptide repeat protein